MRLLDKTLPLLILTAAVNLFVLVAVPDLHQPPPLTDQRTKALEGLIISLAPLVWTIILLAASHTRASRIAALVNLAPAMFWLATILPSVAQAYS